MFKNILLPFDLADETGSSQLIKVAETLSAGEPADVHLLYVDQTNVHGSFPNLGGKTHEQHCKEGKEALARMAKALPGNLNGSSHWREGIPHDQILETAKYLGIEVIVMMASKPGMCSYFIGSNSERVVRHAHCSVFVIREIT